MKTKPNSFFEGRSLYTYINQTRSGSTIVNLNILGIYNQQIVSDSLQSAQNDIKTLRRHQRKKDNIEGKTELGFYIQRWSYI
jgi:hypothetical protein